MPDPIKYRIEIPAGETQEIQLEVVALAAPPVPEPPVIDMAGEWDINVPGQPKTVMLVGQRGQVLDATYGAMEMTGIVDGNMFKLAGNMPGLGEIELIGDEVSGSGKDQVFVGRILINGVPSANVTGDRYIDDDDDGTPDPDPDPIPDPGPIPGPIVGDPDHRLHFAAEAIKPGVIAALAMRDLQTTKRMTGRGDFSAGDTGYDPIVDAAFVRVAPGRPLAQMHLAWHPTNGIYWPSDGQWNTSDFTNLPVTNGKVYCYSEIMLNGAYGSGKLDRFRNGCCGEKNRRLTMNGSFSGGGRVYHRDGGPSLKEIGGPAKDSEVRVWVNDAVTWNSQPCLIDGSLVGPDERHCAQLRKNPQSIPQEHPNVFKFKDGVWMRMLRIFDFDNGLLTILCRRMDDPATIKYVARNFPVSWPAGDGINNYWLGLHSTSRTHNEWPATYPVGYVYYRNAIISKEPIAI